MSESPLAAGLLISVLAERPFNRAYKNDLWTDEDLAPVRKLLQQSFWTWGSVLVIVACLATLILHRSAAGGGLLYILIYPFQVASRIRTTITPAVKRNGGLIDWQNFRPIHSEHWGE